MQRGLQTCGGRANTVGAPPSGGSARGVMRSTGPSKTRVRLLVAALLLPALVWASNPLPSHGADAGGLQRAIERERAAESQARSAAARLSALEREAAREVSLLAGRLAGLRAQAGALQARLARARADMSDAREHALALRRRLSRDRGVLADTLRSGYIAERPDLVAVVLGSTSFADLVERAGFLRRAQQRNASVVQAVRSARARTRVEARRLRALARRRRASAEHARRERDAVAQVASALEARRASLARVRDARLAAAAGAAGDRRRAERELRQLERRRLRAAGQAGPGGPWAIPWPVVQCESGGQNLPPNGAGASGYYQFMPGTWRRLGGSTPHAYQAGKAEQDRLAARLWAGGAGARNWVCAMLVGAG